MIFCESAQAKHGHFLVKNIGSIFAFKTSSLNPLRPVGQQNLRKTVDANQSVDFKSGLTV
jgi:hypothetical protein